MCACLLVFCYSVLTLLFEWHLPCFAGKSNLMDAVSFVLGDKTTNMRSRSLSVSTLILLTCGIVRKCGICYRNSVYASVSLSDTLVLCEKWLNF